MGNPHKSAVLYSAFPLVLMICSLFCRDIIHDPVSIEQNPFTIKYGSSVYLDFMDASVQFLDVLDDSRCPENALCLWAGKADIKLSVSDHNHYMFIVTLRINGNVKETDTNAHVSLDTLGYKFTLMKLDPYPEVNVERDLLKYSALISIIKK